MASEQTYLKALKHVNEKGEEETSRGLATVQAGLGREGGLSEGR